MVVVERRNLAILLGRKPGQNRFARVHDEGVDTRGRDRVDECREKLIVVAVIDADPAFHGDRQVRAITQSAHAIGHQGGLQHEASAERAILDAVAGAADIEIDLGVTRHGADTRRFGKLLGIAAAQLQSDRDVRSRRGRASGARRRARWPWRQSFPCTARHEAHTAGASSGSGGRSNPSWAPRRACDSIRGL